MVETVMREIQGVLGKIVARKRIDVAARLEGRSIEDLRHLCEPGARSLKDALSRPGARFVMEVKRASPSQGVLRAGADPVAQARAYSSVADAISVLTDEPYFHGSFADLEAARAVYDGPILAKDFIVDVRQVAEARRHGADAVLVMLSVLDDGYAALVMEEAARLGMDALVEAHSEDEVRRAVALGAEIIGINNRDLRTLEIDLTVTERLSSLVPRDRVLVSESGIASRADVERLGGHADAFLVGSSLMRAEDPAQAAKELAYGRVKVCGITNEADLALAFAAGASYAGLVMVPNTPRAVTRDRAEVIASAAPIGTRLVGVFRNAEAVDVASAAQAMSLHAVQLHGDEDVEYIEALRGLLPGTCEIWAAVAVDGNIPRPRHGSDRILFDTAVAGRSGGTGQVFDWKRVQDRAELGHGLLAGGLTPANAAQAANVGAYALDVGSGLEAVPGRKDRAKVQAFFEALRVPARAPALPLSYTPSSRLGDQL